MHFLQKKKKISIKLHLLDELFIQRCFDLAKLGSGNVSPNPLVGAVIVHDGEVIGEGWHQEYGKAHAEVNAITSVPAEKQHLLPFSTIYVSLEPCCVHGKTPACTNLIIQKKIPRVVIGCRDIAPAINGQGIQLLRDAGVEVVEGVLEKKARALVRPHEVFNTKNRPYIILKYAQSKDGYIAPKEKRQMWLSHPATKRLTHKWRAEIDAILVGKNTALIDNPSLTTRLYPGKNPLRIVIDKNLDLPGDLKIFNKEVPTLIVNNKIALTEPQNDNSFLEVGYQKQIIPALLHELYKKKVGILMVEGGAHTLQQFMDTGYWDEARVIEAEKAIGGGIKAPTLSGGEFQYEEVLRTDRILYYYNEGKQLPMRRDLML